MNEFPASQLREQLSLAKLQKRHAAKVSLRRASLMICCTVGIGWVTNLDFWQIKEQTQIKVSGVELVDKSTIYSSVSFNYPQPVWQIDGAQLAQSIATIPSIAEVKVNRQVIPPQILISLTEKTPVALASVQGKVGFLDAQGTWIAQEFYSNIAHDDILPQLKVINYDLRLSQIWLNLKS
ncbi:MAG: FtsQ-type POTRA domain-containing protein [Cyanobacteria bacterium J06558_2]